MKETGPLRLFVDAHVFDGKFQGTRPFIQGIYTQLALRPELELFIGAADVENLKKYFPDPGGGRIHYVRYRSGSSLVRLLFEIPSIIRKYSIHWAHFQYICPPIKNCRQVVTTHDILFKDFPQEFPFFYRLIKGFLFRFSASRADTVTTVSAYSKQALEKHFHLPADKVWVVPSGVLPAFFEPYDKEKAREVVAEKFGIRRFILYVSRIEPRKNHALLLKAYLDSALYEKGYSLVLLGHRDIKAPAFDELMDSLPASVRPSVFIRAGISDTDMTEIFRAADLFVYPSRAEGFGLPPLEAAAAKIPVLCSNATAMRDYTFFGDNGTDPDDYDSFRKKLVGMTENPPGLAELTRISEAVRERYSWPGTAKKFLEILTR